MEGVRLRILSLLLLMTWFSLSGADLYLALRWFEGGINTVKATIPQLEKMEYQLRVRDECL